MKNSQKGNVLFLVLIAVALFGALSYTITSSSRNSGGDVSAEKAKLAAGEFLSIASQYRSAVTRIRMSEGIPLVQIDFLMYGNVADGPGCDPCSALWEDQSEQTLKRNIFHSKGGGISPPNIIAENYGTTPSTAIYAGGKPFLVAGDGQMTATGSAGSPGGLTADIQVIGVGNSTGGITPDGLTTELMFMITGVGERVCREINRRSGVGDVIPRQDHLSHTGLDPNSSFTPYSPRENGSSAGAFLVSASSGTIGYDTAGELLRGKMEGCYKSANNAWGGDDYTLYAVIAPQ